MVVMKEILVVNNLSKTVTKSAGGSKRAVQPLNKV